MAEQAIEKKSFEDDDPTSSAKKEDVTNDPEFLSCLLQPSPADSDPNYIGIRRLLLSRKAESGFLRRKDWRCNGKGYVAFRNYINRPQNWESLHTPSHSSTPGQSGRWMPSSSPLSILLDVDSWSTNRLSGIYDTSLSGYKKENQPMTEPQPKYSAFREASFGHAIFDIKNRTHAYYSWHRNQDGYAVQADSLWFYNRFWHPVDDSTSAR
ncbi:unnamed protein product [Ilex paraguariensis]|uniref:Purple acid phosphatase C-terminal domain-containing protein n=1 Tax=Ilex paraguariensis TaxID=185542 RepID=A0ABC8RAQ5_9AQUA